MCGPAVLSSVVSMTWSWITHLVQSYGYYAVFTLIALESIGIPLPGETALITAALYAGTTHQLNIVALAGGGVAQGFVG
jgi:membrane protein DedA with SNARE-associated domain